MNSVILRTSAKLLLPVMLVFSVVILFRGHNDPGGGFIGGLVAASGVAVFAFGFGREEALRALRIDPIVMLGIGLLLGLGSGLFGLFGGDAFLTHRWTFPGGLPIGTALIFDVGVYLVVLGAVTSILFEFMER